MNKNLKQLIIISLAILYILLVFKNPFSVKSLVPNLEPYPDTLYYSNPAWNFVHGKGFIMKAFDYQSKIATPPLYGIYLMPFFTLFGDVRSFYFANLFLMLGSLILFILIANKILYRSLFDILIIVFIGFLFVTNFYIYTLPSLLMAENITLFFSMFALYLFVSQVTIAKSAFGGALGVVLIMIKFSNAPLTATFYALYAWKVLKNVSKPKKKLRRVFGSSLCLSIVLFFIYTVKSQIFIGHKNLSSGVGFSSLYFSQNFWQYLKVLMGHQERFLWFTNKMLSPIVAIPTIMGIAAGLLTSSWKSWRKNALHMFIYGFSPIVFMSFFYTRDIRYILVVYPIMLLFAGFGFLYVKKKFSTGLCITFMTIVGGGYLLFPQLGVISGERAAITFKKQIGLNFRHAEEPWNYKAVVEFNAYFAQRKNKKPYLGTLLPPYFVNYYTNGNYKYLPVSMGQEFFGDKQNAPKIFLLSLTDYYTNLLKEGHDIYISPYYQANLSSWRKDYEDLTSHFNVTLVKNGCYNTCNIYKLSLKM